MTGFARARLPHVQRAIDAPDRLSVSTMVELHREPDARVREAFARLAGVLAGFQARPQQVRFAEMTATAIRVRKALLAELPTGCGKSLGYLIPAAVAGGLVVVATHTKSLQGQLMEKDLPILAQLFPGLRYEALYGRSNYLCYDLARRRKMMDSATLVNWLKTAPDQYLGSLDQTYLTRYRDSLVVAPDDCTGRKCPSVAACGWLAARKRSEHPETRILVTNHALVAADLAAGGGLLPPWNALVLDEAHQFHQVTTEALQTTLSEATIGSLVKKLWGLKDVVPGAGRDVGLTLGQLLRDVAAAARFREGQTEIEVASRLPRQPWPAHAAALEAVALVRARLADYLDLDDDLAPERARAEAMLARLERFSGLLAHLGHPDPSWVLWAERVEEQTLIHSTPVDVSEFLRERLFSRGPVVLCSATLATGRGGNQGGAFDAARAQLGADHPLELQAESPFDFQRNLLYYLPRIVPTKAACQELMKPGREFPGRYARTIAPHVRQVLDATRGRAFVLFTSYAVLRATRPLLTGLAWPLRTQEDGQRGELLEWFRGTTGAVLLATGAFWEGVDVAGEALSCVIIDRFPFGNPESPVEAARQARHGRAGFEKMSIPAAVTKLKQGCGRLIRTVTDRGILCILDPRIHHMGYGREILWTLPGQTHHSSAPDPLDVSLHPDFLARVARWLEGPR